MIRSAAMTANKNLFKLIEGMQLTKSIVTTLDASDASTSGRSSSIGTYARLDEVETVVDEGQGSETGKQETGTSLEREEDPFDYQAVVNALTLQFIDEHEITRVESLEWLLMLQRKAPHKVLATNDGMFPVLLKTLSDSSERVSHSLSISKYYLCSWLGDQTRSTIIGTILYVFR
jgi:vacuole morphology and inheritance protein 14